MAVSTASQPRPTPTLRCADSLRVLGQWLDEQQAERIQVQALPNGFAVQWRRGSEDVALTRAFSQDELARANARSWRRRRDPLGRMGGRWSPALRTLGQDLENRAIAPLLVRTLAGGLQVYGVRESAEVLPWYGLDQLEGWNRVRHGARSLQQLRAGAHWRGRRWLAAPGRRWILVAGIVVVLMLLTTGFLVLRPGRSGPDGIPEAPVVETTQPAPAVSLPPAPARCSHLADYLSDPFLCLRVRGR